MRNFLVGLGVGYVAGILLAPGRGEEIRERIIERVSRLISPGQEEVPGAATSSLAYALNEATEEELKAVRGIGKGLARKIIRNRPYKTGNEVVEDKVLPEPTFERLKEQFT